MGQTPEESDADLLRVMKGLDKRWRRTGEVRLCQNLHDMPGVAWNATTSLLLYAPEFPGEVDVASFALSSPEHIKRYLLRSYAEFPPSYWYIPLAESDMTPIHPFKPELRVGERIAALIPGLLFDKSGRRKPFPGDCFSRAFSAFAEGSLVRIGIGWSLQLCDKPLAGIQEVDFVVTERGVVEMSES